MMRCQYASFRFDSLKLDSTCVFPGSLQTFAPQLLINQKARLQTWHLTYSTLLLAFSVVLHLMLLLPATLYTNHSKHVEPSYIVLQVDI
jgi:hypothetical protein